MKYGFVKVAAAVPTVKVADVEYNVQQIESLIAQAEGRGIEIIVFPELSVTGYTCQDLFKEQVLLDRAESAILTLLDFTRKLDIISIVGVPIVINGLLYNCAAVIQGGSLMGIVPKTYLPNYAEFYEKRWFASAQDLNPSEIYFAGSQIAVTALSLGRAIGKIGTASIHLPYSDGIKLDAPMLKRRCPYRKIHFRHKPHQSYFNHPAGWRHTKTLPSGHRQAFPAPAGKTRSLVRERSNCIFQPAGRIHAPSVGYHQHFVVFSGVKIDRAGASVYSVTGKTHTLGQTAFKLVVGIEEYINASYSIFRSGHTAARACGRKPPA